MSVRTRLAPVPVRLLPIVAALVALAAALLGFSANPASAQSVEWSTSPCTFGVVFPGQPRIETQTQSAGDGQGTMRMVSAGLVKSDTGVLVAACATFGVPIGEAEVQGFVNGITSGLLTRVLDEGPCTFGARTVPCRTVESIEMVGGEPHQSATVQALADGNSVFLLQILSMVNTTADSRAIDDNFKMSLTPLAP